MRLSDYGIVSIFQVELAANPRDIELVNFAKQLEIECETLQRVSSVYMYVCVCLCVCIRNTWRVVVITLMINLLLFLFRVCIETLCKKSYVALLS